MAASVEAESKIATEEIEKKTTSSIRAKPKITMEEIEREMEAMPPHLFELIERRIVATFKRATAKADLQRKRRGKSSRKARSYDFSTMSHNCVSAVLQMLFVESTGASFELKQVTVDERTLEHEDTFSFVIPNSREIVLTGSPKTGEHVVGIIRCMMGESATLKIEESLLHLHPDVLRWVIAEAWLRDILLYHCVDGQYVFLEQEYPFKYLKKDQREAYYKLWLSRGDSTKFR